MKIWKVKVEFGNYKSFQLINMDSELLKEFNREMIIGKPQNGKWDNMEIELIEGNVDSDLSKIWNAVNMLVFSEKAKGNLEALFKDWVEYIPVKYKGTTLYMVNILSIIDALDYDNVTFRKQDTGFIVGVEKYSFISSKIKGINVFKVMLNGRNYPTEIFVTSEVKKQAEDSKLLGFKFEEAWNSEAD